VIVILTCMFAIVPVDLYLSERCSEIELNRLYSEDCRPQLIQAIFWEPSANGGYQVRAWRLVNVVNGDRNTINHPIPCRRGWMFIYQGDKRLRVIYADRCRHTWTQFDPEVRCDCVLLWFSSDQFPSFFLRQPREATQLHRPQQGVSVRLRGEVQEVLHGKEG